MEETAVLVLDDYRAINKARCHQTFRENAQKVELLRQQIVIRYHPVHAVIVALNNSRSHARQLDALEEKLRRDTGAKECPVVISILMRNEIEWTLDLFDESAAEKLRKIKGVALVVFDHETVEVIAI